MLSFQPLFAPSLGWQISNKLSTTCKKPDDVKRHTSHKVLRTSVPRLEQPCSKSGTHIDKAVTSCKQLVPSKLVLHAQPFVNVFKYILYIAHARLYVICLERRALIRSSCHINKPQFYARRSPSQRKVENALPRSYNLVHNSWLWKLNTIKNNKWNYLTMYYQTTSHSIIQSHVASYSIISIIQHLQKT